MFAGKKDLINSLLNQIIKVEGYQKNKRKKGIGGWSRTPKRLAGGAGLL